MPAGTPGFVGARLTEAREARGLTALALANLLGVSRAAVSQYEGGQSSPRPEVMERIAEMLRLPLHFFVRPVSKRESSTIFYRSRSAATKSARTRAERRLQWLWEEIVPYLSEFIELPRANFPVVDLPDDLVALSSDRIEGIAQEVRRAWGIGDGPISNLVWLMENNGAIVTREELGAETLDSFSTWIDGRPYVFLNADKMSAARSRFDAAHELAHLILHRNVKPKAIDDPKVHRLVEDQAHRFAGAFLLPTQSFSRDVFHPTLAVLRALKPKWGVSIGAMIMRVDSLGFVSEDEARALWIAYSRRGWKRGEPLDDQLPVEEPRLKLHALDLLLGEGVQAISDLLSTIPYPATDIEELAVLPRGYLSPKPPPVRLRTRGTDHSPDDSSRAQIIEFPIDRG